jgi:DNA-binding CsgD family transcriptional regulator
MNQDPTESHWQTFKKWRMNKEGKSHDDVSADLYNNHHPLFSPAINISNSVVAVIDLKTLTFIYSSPNYPEFTGWREEDIKTGGIKFVFSKVTPNDQEGVNAFGKLINNYFKQLPDQQRKHFRSYWDFSVCDNKGKIFKVLQQDCAFKYDSKGNIEELLLSAVKIDNIIPDSSQHLRLTNGIENFFYKYDHGKKSIVQLQLLSDREMEIVKMIAKSMTLKEIGANLSISFNTVKVHSANMMRKLQVKDSIEMINLLRVWGFI